MNLNDKTYTSYKNDTREYVYSDMDQSCGEKLNATLNTIDSSTHLRSQYNFGSPHYQCIFDEYNGQWSSNKRMSGKHN